MPIRHLNSFFAPESLIAVTGGVKVGGSEALLLNNIAAEFTGKLSLIHHHAKHYPEQFQSISRLRDLDYTPELAIITRRLDEAPTWLERLGKRGVKAAILVADMPGGGGDKLRDQILAMSRQYGIRVLGPNCLGAASPANLLNACITQSKIEAGNISLISDSCAMIRTLIARASQRGTGFAKVAAMGSRIDVDFGDMLDFLTRDSQTRAIVIYLESIFRTRKFMSAARAASRVKPVIVLKPRNTHKNPVEDSVYGAAFRRAGILRVHTIEQLFIAIDTLPNVRRANGNRLAMVSNSKAMSLLANDWLTLSGGKTAALSDQTKQALRDINTSTNGRSNPLDLGDLAGPVAYIQATEQLLKDPNVDGLVIIKSPSGRDNDMAIAKALAPVIKASQRPILLGWPGGDSALEARDWLHGEGIGAYASPEEAVTSFIGISRYYRYQKMLTETPPSLPEAFSADSARAQQIVELALSEGRELLNVKETAQLLDCYGIPVVKTYPAQTPDQAAEIAALLNSQVALKIDSPNISRKSAVGGCVLGLESADSVRDAATTMLRRLSESHPEAKLLGFQLQPMISHDGAIETTIGALDGGPFGPVMRFGHGGTERRVIGDMAYALPPLNMHLAQEVISHTRIATALRQRISNPDALEATSMAMIRVSQMVVDLGKVCEIDINPLWIKSDGILAVDTLVRIRENTEAATARLAIRPYPKELEKSFTLANGNELLLRPILPEDEPRLQEMVKRIPAEDLRMRFFQTIRELSHTMAARLTQIDYDREMALVVTDSGTPGQSTLWAVVRISADPDLDKAEYAIIVDAAMSRQGLGTMLMRRIIDYARERKIGEIYGEVLSENRGMLKLNRALGFKLASSPDDPGIIHVSLKL